MATGLYSPTWQNITYSAQFGAIYAGRVSDGKVIRINTATNEETVVFAHAAPYF
ncbi:MAG: hypothetical protein FJZ00_02990 [Candidatus Sericytochromatia bacterium]|uniref:Uncharacterized protein n=1 Tax=Candidatus Tanganyikabacteria bacterium TaxID=2961651 RepID=A0A937X2I7_9BACT|nr:hypothetical protein [Candidatus Tanganyikabacteria bacterium]